METNVDDCVRFRTSINEIILVANKSPTAHAPPTAGSTFGRKRLGDMDVLLPISGKELWHQSPRNVIPHRRLVISYSRAC